MQQMGSGRVDQQPLFFTVGALDQNKQQVSDSVGCADAKNRYGLPANLTYRHLCRLLYCHNQR